MYLDSYLWVQCVEHTEETLSYLFFDCPFSQACWLFLGIHCDLSQDFLHMVLQARQAFGNSIFREVLILAGWGIWCHRNNIIFNNGVTSFSFWRSCFERELKLVTLRVKPVLKDKINCFLSSLL
ncbi:hypothetical protein HU200_008715 [Digitaria exilis]|uniref:Reverse transcriptase zinc-binding domain-containing protein n=1 Tax=Digitaria exilis TaxID=1010633 RepID=A0A835FLE0_9POAL|nr:hypothetical protein HU200_008715 [Digitaria exilis]